MSIRRTTNYPYPKNLDTPQKIEKYLQNLYRALKQESSNRLRDFDDYSVSKKITYLAKAYRNGNQANTAAGWQKVQLNAEVYDPGSHFDSTTNYLFTVPRTGYYLVAGSVRFTTVTAGIIGAAVYVVSTRKTHLGVGEVLAASTCGFSGADILYCTADQTISLYYYNDQTDGSVIGAGVYDSYLSVALLAL